MSLLICPTIVGSVIGFGEFNIDVTGVSVDIVDMEIEKNKVVRTNRESVDSITIINVWILGDNELDVIYLLDIFACSQGQVRSSRRKVDIQMCNVSFLSIDSEGFDIRGLDSDEVVLKIPRWEVKFEVITLSNPPFYVVPFKCEFYFSRALCCEIRNLAGFGGRDLL